MTEIENKIRNRLLEFGANSTDPRWSSHLLEELLRTASECDEGVQAVFKVLFPLLKQPVLSDELAHLIKDISTIAFTRFRSSYESGSIDWLDAQAQIDLQAPQAYLCMYVIPPDSLTAELAVTILRSLEGAPFWQEALANLEDDLMTSEAKTLLRNWLEQGVDPDCSADIERLVIADSGG